MHPSRSHLLAASLAVVVALGACGGDSAAPPVPEAVEAVGGNNQTVQVATAAPAPLMVRVVDSRGNPVSGEEVTWAVTEGSATIAPGTSTTDASGQATTTVTLGQQVGAVTVTATARDLAPATFSLTGTAGPAAGVAPVSGGGQTAAAGSVLPNPLVVEARDAFGNPVAGATVTFTADAGVITDQATTDAQGRAEAAWTLGTAVGTQRATATVGSQTASFTATATAGAAAGLEKVSGDEQTAAPGAELAQPLVVRVVDAFGNPVSNEPVSFSTPHGGSFSPASPFTGSQGTAQATWTLGGEEQPENQTATATVAGQSVTFTARAFDPCAVLDPYQPGATVTGMLEAGDCVDSGFIADRYSFSFGQQARYTFAMTADAFTPLLAFSPPAFGFIAGGPGTVEFQLLGGAGDYVMDVSSAQAGSTGSYTVESAPVTGSADVCVPILTARAIQVTEAISGNDCAAALSGHGGSDRYFTFLEAGTTVSITMSSSAFAPVLALAEFSGAGYSLVALDSGTVAQSATIQHTVTQANVFQVAVMAAAPGDAGAYQFSQSTAAALRSGERSEVRVRTVAPQQLRGADSPFLLPGTVTARARAGEPGAADDPGGAH